MKVKLPVTLQMKLKFVCCSILLCLVDHVSAQSWVSNNVPISQWSSVACSADGTKLVAAALEGNIYSSTNSGATWTTNGAPMNGWASVASSADGNKLVAAISGGGIYDSTDAGLTWNPSDAPSQNWRQVVGSADGVDLYAVTYLGNCYYSTNSGTNWTAFKNLPSPAIYWSSIACSADGKKVIAVVSVDGTPAYISTNSGASWATNSSIDGQPLAGVASSASGSEFFLMSRGFIFVSTNTGVSWVQRTRAGGGNSIACSADGSMLLTADNGSPPFTNDYVFTSTNLGSTWTTTGITNVSVRQALPTVAASADGNKLVLVHGNALEDFGGPGFPGPIFTFQSAPNPLLNISTASSNLLISWIVPSTNMVIQQSPDLLAWAGLTNAPTLNLSNLQCQIMLPLPVGSGFYRLTSP